MIRTVGARAIPLRFVILFNGRSGSTNLIEALDSHSQVRARREFLTGLDEDERLPAAREFLMRVPEHFSAVGFKTKLRDVPNPQEFGKLLLEMSASIILLRRRNVVKQTVSLINCFPLVKTTGDWNLYHEGKRLPPATIPPAHFDETLKRVEKEKHELETYVEKLDLPTLSIFYEELLVDQRAALNRVCSFLGVRFEPVRGRSIKHTSDDLRQAVSNFEDLRSNYGGTPYAQMFDEILLPM